MSVRGRGRRGRGPGGRPETTEEYHASLRKSNTPPFDLCGPSNPRDGPNPFYKVQKDELLEVKGKGTAIIPFPSQLTPTPVTNQFTVLGQIPKPFNQALASQPADNNPFEIQNIQKPIKPNYTKSSPHIPKCLTNLFYVEPSMSDIDDPLMLALQYFPPGWHFLPQATHKTLKFYNKILVSTESIFIKPIYDKDDSSKVIYHSLFIKKLITFEEWGSNPYDLFQLSGTDQFFNYHDYIEAWMKILCYQNETFNHSWFIQFDQHFKPNFPNWFIRWWEQFGPDPNYLPETLRGYMDYFGRISPLITESPMPLIILFLSKYKVPWILKWQYYLNKSPVVDQTHLSTGSSSSIIKTHGQFDIVSRQTFVKWWDKYTIDRIINIILKEFPPPQGPIAQVETQPLSSPLTVPKPDKASGSGTKTPTEPKTVKEAEVSPSPSSKTLDLDSLSPAQMRTILAALNNPPKEVPHKVEGSPKSDEGSTISPSQPKNWYEMTLFEDAQDPYG